MNEYEKIIDSIDQKGFYSEYISNISKQFEKVISNNQTQDYSIIQRCKWEKDFFNFIIEDGKIIPMFSTSDKSGNIYEYPNFLEIGDDGLSYLIKRSKKTNSPQIKAHYNHLLWLSPKKNHCFANFSIDNYFKILEINSTKRFLSWLETVKIIRNLLSISIESNQRIIEVKDWILEVLNQIDLTNHDSRFILKNLSRLMLDKKKTFKATDLEINSLKLQQLIELNFNDNDFYSALETIKLLIKIKEKRRENCKINKKQLAEIYDAITRHFKRQTQKKTFFAGYFQCHLLFA